MFERRLIEKYIAENGTDPISGEPVSEEQLIDIKGWIIINWHIPFKQNCLIKTWKQILLWLGSSYRTPLFRGKGRSFSGSRNPILTFFQGTACYSKSYWPQKKVDKLHCSPVKLATTFKIWTIFRSNQCIKLVGLQHTTSRRYYKLNHDFLIIIWPL